MIRIPSLPPRQVSSALALQQLSCPPHRYRKSHRNRATAPLISAVSPVSPKARRPHAAISPPRFRQRPPPCLRSRNQGNQLLPLQFSSGLGSAVLARRYHLPPGIVLMGRASSAKHRPIQHPSKSRHPPRNALRRLPCHWRSLLVLRR